MITVALPKVRLADETLEILEKIFGKSFRFDDRKLILEEGGFRFLLVRNQDVPAYVLHQSADIGVVGLDVAINPSVALDALPQKTGDAISYGVVKPILLMLEATCKDKKIFFAGGDGKFFSKYFQNAFFDRSLVFRGMQKAIQEAHLEE